MPSPITWSGEQVVRIVGTGLHEDTLRIRPSDLEQRENRYRLRLPTLCITYADMKFANDIGGEQERWPGSAAYGPQFFDPPVVIDRADIERLTWIRGAERVTIGPKETVIEWFGFRELVVPRMRLSVSDPVEAGVEVVSSVIDVGEELRLDVAQYANGRLIGGVQVAKRHPDWKPPEEPTSYRLWIRVIDADRQQPFRKARLLLSQWDGKGFTPLESASTDPDGSLVRDERKPGELEAVSLAMKGWWAVPRVWRVLPGQQLNLLLEAARWCRRSTRSRPPGHAARVFVARYPLQPGDTPSTVAELFRYRDADERRRPGRHRPLGERDRAQPAGLVLHAGPDRRHARRNRTGLRCAPRPATDAGRRHRPDPRVPLEHEVVAVPGTESASGRKPCESTERPQRRGERMRPTEHTASEPLRGGWSGCRRARPRAVRPIVLVAVLLLLAGCDAAGDSNEIAAGKIT